MPAMSRTICIGSAYWRLNCCQREAFFASANVFVPNVARRASASAEPGWCAVRGAAGDVPSARTASGCA